MSEREKNCNKEEWNAHFDFKISKNINIAFQLAWLRNNFSMRFSQVIREKSKSTKLLTQSKKEFRWDYRKSSGYCPFNAFVEWKLNTSGRWVPPPSITTTTGPRSTTCTGSSTSPTTKTPRWRSKKKKKTFFGIRFALCQPHSQRLFSLLAVHVLE